MIVRERLAPRLKRSLSRAFKSAEDAILELVDNSVDDRTAGQPLLVKVNVSPEETLVFDSGGKGMGPEALEDRFLNWGESAKTGTLGRYGQGGKAAMLYLGTEWELRCKRPGDRVFYAIADPDSRDCTRLKEYRVRETPADEECWPIGSVQIRVRKLERAASPLGLSRRLAEVYRPLVEEEALRLYVNDKPVEPQEWPVKKHQVYLDHETESGHGVTGWAGILERGSRLKGGIRCYAFGRLIEASWYFGHPQPTYRASLNFLIGQVFLDHVPLTSNKTSFDRGSPEWKEAESFVHEQIAPIIKELLATPEGREITKRENNRLQEARSLFEEAIQRLRKDEEMQEKIQALIGKFRGEQGRKPPERRGRRTAKAEPPSASKKAREPRTPPPPDAVGILRRLGNIAPWELKHLPEDQRTAIDAASRRIYVNVDFPLYKQRDGDALYLAESAVLEFCHGLGIDRTSGEFLDDVNRILHTICRVREERPARST